MTAVVNSSDTDGLEPGPHLVAVKYDRWHRFVISRHLDPNGLYTYRLVNEVKKETLAIPLDLFERFRSDVRDFVGAGESSETESTQAELRFGGRVYFLFQRGRLPADWIKIQSFGADETPNSEFSITAQAGEALVSALYSSQLEHPHDLLIRIITYHRLFSATFQEGSESITSNLQLRKNLLSYVDKYSPALARKTPDVKTEEPTDPGALKEITVRAPEPRKNKSFRSRLGERDQAKEYQVDYEELFAGGKKTASRRRSVTTPISELNASQSPDDTLDHFSVPLFASDIKSFAKVPFRCELSRGDVKILRQNFLDDRDATFFLGFEMLDCIYEYRKKLYTYRFPLYYFPVRIVESGREAILHPLEDNRFYLNHFALANLVEEYSSSGAAAKRLSDLLSSLLTHQFIVRGTQDRIRILRMLPCHSEVFDRTREILLGLPGEQGKGGILSEVKVRAIECDLESVVLYKAPQSSSPITRALEDDLAQILNFAKRGQEGYKASLLSRSLTGNSTTTSDNVFSHTLSMHSAPTGAVRTLVDRLNENDLVLLEGPPGTGKTYTIANLLIHCAATGRRLLVVSDQKAAIQALGEQIQQYVVGNRRDTPEGRQLDLLWRLAIKVVDHLPEGNESLATWARQVRRMLGVDISKELEWASPVDGYERSIARLDTKIAETVHEISTAVQRRFGRDRPSGLPGVADKSSHPTDVAEVQAELERAERMLDLDGLRAHLKTYISALQRLTDIQLYPAYDLFSLKGRRDVAVRRLEETLGWLRNLGAEMPTSMADYEQVETPEVARPTQTALGERWKEVYPTRQGWTARAVRFIRAFSAGSSLKRLVNELIDMFEAQIEFWERQSAWDTEIWDSLSGLHSALSPEEKGSIDVALELLLAECSELHNEESIHEKLERVAQLQSDRDDLVRRQFLYGLGRIGERAFSAARGGGTNRLTSILAILDRLESAPSWVKAQDTVRELQDLLFDVFPIWLCRKQAVPFLLPCTEQSFDLVVVDEATQCRVDDALPLLFRGKKLMAVGDERQTVLAKNSAIDDYLFDDFELDEHLRLAQARGIKGGGSHLFGLVKRIKQAAVMLDEHYRCPPDIIEFSNRYVYDNQLRTMQWKMLGSPHSVVVDGSETRLVASDRVRTGKYKGIETGMVDRFFAYVARILKRIERETGEEINPETDVAIVYFLLKNEAYIKDTKSELLRKLPRGSDILDGAGTALQGKERSYIFYLWDVTRYNIAAFRQGDDETKRKGELNVLMSRPKKRAYHFLHREFDNLKHHTSSITDYLMRLRQKNYRAQTQKIERGSGVLMKSLLERIFQDEGLDPNDLQMSVQIGNPLLGVDLMWLPPGDQRSKQSSIGMVDLSIFADSRDPGQDIVDYFFQVQRAIPKVMPVFGFVHEFARPSSVVVSRLKTLNVNRES